MFLWLIFAAMTAAAMFAVIWPLARHRDAARSGSDIAVYRDQLEELERDLAGGIIRESEAQAARVEISRRLLAASDAAQALPTASGSAAARRPIVAAALALPLLAGGLYGWLGSPGLGLEFQSAQHDSRAPDQSVENLVVQAEAYLARHPEDGHGWEVLAPVFLRLDRYADAVTAWENVLRILGENAARDADLGEALTMEANGVVTAAAKAAFLRASSLDATSVSARYYLGLAAEQDGERDRAATMWRDLLAEAPPGAFWIGRVREALVRVETGAASPAGPAAAQMPAAAARPPEQEAMIHGMVDRLAARLKQDGSDVDGWVRLVRSYRVLGDAEKVRGAMADARQALAGDPGNLERLNTAFKELESANPASPAPVPGLAAAQMPAPARPLPSGQAAMIQSMVDRLAARLEQNGSDVEGWVRLVRSYTVLGDVEKARAATNDARRALAGDPDRLKKLETGLQEIAQGNAGSSAELAAAPGAGQLNASGPAPAAHEQGAMNQDMVQRLAERLKVSGSGPEGWLMLVRSYRALGENDKATTAIEGARQALAGDRDKLEQFNTALTKLQNPP
jgi:cytochrome c-type biogenesis protein CcmH